MPEYSEEASATSGLTIFLSAAGKEEQKQTPAFILMQNGLLLGMTSIVNQQPVWRLLAYAHTT